MYKQARRSYPEGSMKPSSLFIGAILIMSVGMAPYSYAADPSQDLVGWWTFDEGSGNTLFDASGNAYNGTIFGDPKWVSGRSGTALEFDGVDDYVDTFFMENLPVWTVCVWVRSPLGPSTRTETGPVHRQQNFQINWDHGSSSWRGAAGVKVGATWYPASYGSLQGNRWYHLIASYDGESLITYKNGVLITRQDSPSGPAATEMNSLKLARHAASLNFFKGTIDDVRIYRRALNMSEIAAVFEEDIFNDDLWDQIDPDFILSEEPIRWDMNGHFYQAVNVPGGIYWSQAKEIAEESGGYLASITSPQENEFVFQLINDPKYWSASGDKWWGPWLGGFQPHGSPEPSGNWQWVSGEPLGYTNWFSGEPNNDKSGEWCTHYFCFNTNIRVPTWNDLPDEYSANAIAGFIIEYEGFGGGTGIIGDPYLIYTPAQLNLIGSLPAEWGKHFRLMADIDMSTYTGTAYNIIGNDSAKFTGMFDGNGHIISNLTYVTTTATNYVGLFGFTDNATIQNVRLEDVTISTTGNYNGGLVGSQYSGTIRNCYSSGSVSGDSGNSNWIGGLVGLNDLGIITDCHSNGLINGGSQGVGGLVGMNQGTVISCDSMASVNGGNWSIGGLVGINYGLITACSSSGDVIGTNRQVGGLVGLNHNSGKVSYCYSTGSIRGTERVGGLIGYNITNGMIANCYAMGSVNGEVYIGGLVGQNIAVIRNSYSASTVSGTSSVGGLVGWTNNTIMNSFSCGSVSGSDNFGGLVGYNSGIITSSFYDSQTSGQSDTGKGIPQTTAQMKQQGTFVGWDFLSESANGMADIWRMCLDGLDYPRLSWEYSTRGDYDCPDGVEMEDLMYLAMRWMTTTAVEMGRNDTNGDGKTDLADFALISGNWLRDRFVRFSYNSLETTPGWMMEGQWAFGQPTGDGGEEKGNPDPSSGKTGSNVYGMNLNGDYSVVLGGPYSLIAGPFDCFEFNEVKVRFARWLNTDAPNYVLCTFDVSNDGSTWETVWQNSSTVTDNDWSFVEYDVSSVADENSTVFFRWTYNILHDRAYPYSGWNIDDIELVGKRIVVKPVIQPDGGTFTNPQEVGLECITEGAEIFYTTDGSEPTLQSILYTRPFTIDAPCSVRAKTIKGKDWESENVSAVFVFEVATPKIVPDTGIFSSPQEIALSCVTEGATIYYSTNGFEPTQQSTKYTGPFTVSSSCTIKFTAFRAGWIDSGIGSATYIFVPESMVIIPAGTFQMGDSFNEGNSDELPIHIMTLDSFAIGKYEITNEQYCAFLNSAYPSQVKVVNGIVYAAGDTAKSFPYCKTSTFSPDSQIAFSNNTFSVRTKNGRDMSKDPTGCVFWYGAVAYCNWRSQQEGKPICYNLSNWVCDFSKKGYRLPMEAEWEYAARGGLTGKRFPWGDTITHNQANYNSYWEGGKPCWPYDVNLTEGYHPTWNDGIPPYTSPVGSFSLNGFGLYDMAGNVWEWCHGLTVSDHVIRGGGLDWDDSARSCRVSSRFVEEPCIPIPDEPDPAYCSFNSGFRVVLGL